MLFSSIVFLFYFLPLFFALYAACRGSNVILLAGSVLFYVWGEARYLWLLCLVGLIAWLGGRAIHAHQNSGRDDRLILTATIATQLLLLGIFKYAPFVSGQLSILSPLLSRNPLAHLALPLGISFFTFHAISYVMDIHRRTVPRPATPLQLGGNRAGSRKTYRNLWLVFLLCGLWHGAAWTFVLWGIYHGGFLVLERAGLGHALARAWRPLRHLYALLVIALGWVLFRAPDAGHAGMMMKAMAGLGAVRQPGFGQYAPASVLTALAVGSAVSVPWTTLHARLPTTEAVGILSGVTTAGLLVMLLILSAASLATGTYNPFIYFRF